jgi:hypothetical protein
MREILYKENLKTFYVDEKYNFNGTYINGFYHGVCIDFSLLLLQFSFIKNGNVIATA